MKVKSSNKEIIILRHNGGQLGNQLLLYASVYAYCIEKGYKCVNYSFYEYNRYFNFRIPNFWTRIFENLNDLRFYKSRIITYQIYKLTSHLLPLFKKGIILKEDPENIFFLPPTQVRNNKHKTVIKQLEDSSNKLIYVDGWTFRNPAGLQRYHNQIIQFFLPRKEIIEKAGKFINKIKKDNYLVGIHIRQGEYKSKKFLGGKFYFEESEVAEILRHYLKKEHKDSQKILFVLCSDEPLDKSYFPGLKIRQSIGTMMEDLITLSMCNIIIGSNSTFGSFAAYYGNVPFFIFDRDKKYVKAKGDNLMQGV